MVAPFRRVGFRSVLVILVVGCIPSMAQAAVRCIEDVSQVQATLNTALASAEAVEDVRFKSGLYTFSSGTIGYFGVLEGTGKTLTISGGWSGGVGQCTSQSGDPTATILSGNNARPVFGINASTTFTGSTIIQNITFTAGRSDGVSTPSCLFLGEQNGGVMGVRVDRVWVESCVSTVASGPNPHSVSLVSSSAMIVRNSIIASNNSGEALPISVGLKAGVGYVLNNTIAKNTSADSNGYAGLAASASTGAELIIGNNLMDENVATEATRVDIRVGGTGTIRLKNNRFSGLSGVPTENTGSSTGSAGFNGSGYDLDSTSTAIDAGTFFAALIQGSLDIISNARVIGSAVDLGAFEFQDPPGTGPAYSSNPTPAQDIDLGSVHQNATDPFLDLEITNTGAPATTLTGSCSITAGGGVFSISGDAGISAAQGASDSIRVVCDSAQAVQAHIGEMQCDHDGESPGEESPAVYQLDCTILPEPESDVIPDPSSGTTLEGVVDPGGAISFDVIFPEVKDEGADATLVDCSLDDGSVFNITSPGSFPQTIDSGSSVTVTVEGTAPGGSGTITDTLRCMYGDSDSDDVEVVYPISVVISEKAQFAVTKDFTDDNPGAVTVRLECNTGLPLEQEKPITEGDGNPAVVFLITSFDSGELNCSISEDPPPGYDASYSASGDSSHSDELQGCVFTAVSAGDGNACHITNTPAPVDVIINKEWVFAGGTETDVDTRYDLTLFCDAEIVGGTGGEVVLVAESLNGGGCGFFASAEGPAAGPGQWCKDFSGDGPGDFTAQVIPGYPSTHCYVSERVYDNAIEVDNGCDDIEVSAGNGDECTITNTVFFEGIPTLSPRGLAVLALLTLGLGLVIVRRIA